MFFNWILSYILAVAFGLGPQPIPITDMKVLPLSEQAADCLIGSVTGNTLVIAVTKSKMEAYCVPSNMEVEPAQ